MFPDPFCVRSIKKPDSVEQSADSARCGFDFVRPGSDEVCCEGLKTRFFVNWDISG